mmetsp:Transcript_76171/g.93528  ORF Transcript_76171/g.93528 Transcript_76171/m.93528 type:complete len:390 (+) Transcript_76171:96-1265(+)
MKTVILGLLLFGYIAHCKVIFKETFGTDPFESNRWVVSNNKKDSDEAGTLEWSGGIWGAGDRKGIRTTEDAKFYSFSTKMSETFDNEGKTLAFGFRVKHEQKIDCGGGYAKLLGPDIDQSTFNGATPYSIMFGPDICGYSTKKVQAIFNNFEGKNLLKDSDVTCPDDEYTHDYTFVINSDDTYAIYVDGESKASGNIKDDWKFELPKKIKDPDDKKPSDWVDDEMMDDPDDTKPDDWDDEPATIADPDAEKPDDWDDDEDGEWQAPEIENPKYKGEWKPKRIKNPDYKGPWIQKEIDNPNYVAKSDVYKRGKIGVIGVEIWQVKSGTVFSDFILADSYDDVKAFFKDTSVNIDDEKAAKEAYDESQKPEETSDDEDEPELDDDEPKTEI